MESTPPIESLLYVSSARRDIGDAEFDALIAAAQAKNAGRGLTGALLKYGSRFVQVLEGPPEAVDDCFATIAADPRHGDIRVVQRRTAASRRFAAWSMRHVRLSSGSDKVVDAFLGELAADPPDPAAAARAIELLAALAGRAASG